MKNELVNILKNIIENEVSIEKLKKDLALKSDFNLIDAFQFLDKFNLKYLFKNDLEDGMRRLGVKISKA